MALKALPVGGPAHVNPHFQPHLPTPEKTPDGAHPTVNLPPPSAYTLPPSLSAAPQSSAPDETPSTVPVTSADALLEDSDGVKVKIPGSEAQVVSQIPTPVISTNGSAILYSSPTPPQPQPQYPIAISPQPYPTLTSSENGSISSSGHLIPQTQLPPGIGIGPSGEFYSLANGAPVNFRPVNVASQQPYAHRNGFYPSPQRHFQTPPQHQVPQSMYIGHSHHQHQQSFNPIPLPQRSDSPFNPYGQSQPGFFVPARPTQKVSIRAPTSTDESGEPSSKPVYPSIQAPQDNYYQPNPYNPYQQESNGYYPTGQNGWIQHQQQPQYVNIEGMQMGQYGYEDYPGY
ncbi:hypothetical protein P7C73_g1874, partial [Tremellales sp. Uapishka_1]